MLSCFAGLTVHKDKRPIIQAQNLQHKMSYSTSEMTPDSCNIEGIQQVFTYFIITVPIYKVVLTKTK